MNSNARKILSLLHGRPQTVRELMRLTGFSDKQARSAIDALRANEHCVWHDLQRGGFWIDTPVSRGMPAGSGRWKRLTA